MACVRRKQGAGAHGFGQQQHIAGLHAALAHHAVHLLVDQAVDGKAQGQLRALARVAAHQGATCGVQHLDGATHHLRQQVFDFALQARRHGDHGGGGLGFAAHGKNIAQRVVRRHFAKQIRVVDEGPEKVHRLHHGHAWRHAHHGRVVGRVQADQHIGSFHRLQAAQCAGQDVGADLGTAAAAAHGDGRDGLQGLLGCQAQARGGGFALRLDVLEELAHRPHGRLQIGARRLGCHVGQFGEAAHELPIDPVLPAPHPVTAKAPRPTRTHRITVAGRDQGQPVALWVVSQQFLAAQTAAQILGQRLGHAHGKHTGFFQRAFHQRGNIARCEHQRVIQALQLGVNEDEAFVIERQTRALQPGRATGLCDPHGFVGIEGAAIARVQAAGRDLHHLGMRVHLDIALLQHFDKACPHAWVVCGQDRVA